MRRPAAPAAARVAASAGAPALVPSPSYILTRLLQIVPTFFFIMVVMFVLVRLLPGDPTSAILGDRATDADVARINAQLGLDRPIPVQFLIFLERLRRRAISASPSPQAPVMRLDRRAAAGDAGAHRLCGAPGLAAGGAAGLRRGAARATGWPTC